MLKKLLLPLLILWFGSFGAWAHASADADVSTDVSRQQVEVGVTDLAIIAFYLVGIVALGCWAGLRQRKRAGGKDYFLAGKSLKWPMIGLALFATNISTIHLVSFAQNGYTSGLVYGNFEWMAAFTLIMLAWFFAPFYIRSGVATLPDFMEKRYSRGNRDYLAVLSIFSAITVHIGFSLYAGAMVIEDIVLEPFVNDPEQYRILTIVGICGATALYTIVGGLLAVVVTESIQTVVLLVGSICITILGLYMLGGWDGSWGGLLAVSQVSEGWGQMKQSVHPVNLSMVRPDTDPTGISWYAVMLGYPVLGIWYWCTDQTIVQRVLGAKDENHARVGPIFAGFIKILPVLIFVIPGVICLGLINSRAIPGLPVGADGSPNTEKTYSHLINTVLPVGMRGVVVAALLAALMSTVSGALNSIATLFSYDIYKRFKPQANDRHLVRVGRIATFCAMVVAIVWTIAGIGGGKSIFQMMVDVFPVVAPPTAVVFLWGVFWRKASARAALITLVGGSIVGLGVFILSAKGLNKIGDYEINSLLAAFLLFVLESLALMILSFVFPHKHTAESESLVWKSPLEALRGKTWRGLGDYRVLSVLLIVVMVGFYFWYRGDDSYYSIEGEVKLADGTPVIGAQLMLETDNQWIGDIGITDREGQYHAATKTKAGGVPEGTYRVRIIPARDFVVQLVDGAEDKIDKVLAGVPAGTALEERVEEGKRYLVADTKHELFVVLEKGKKWKVLRASEIPEPYREFGTSGLEVTVEPRVNHRNFDLTGSGASPAAE